MSTPDPPLSASRSLRVPFCFVPAGERLPAAWAARHPGAVKFPAKFRARPEAVRSAEPPLSRMGDAPPSAVEAAADSGAPAPRPHPAAPRITQHRPPPRLPAHHAPPPTAYAGPQALLAQAGIALSPTARRDALRASQAMLDALAGQAASAAAIAEFANPAAVAGAILLTSKPAGAGEEQALRRVLVGRRAAGRHHFDMPPPSPPVPGFVPPPLPRRQPDGGGFTPTPPEKPRPGFTPAPLPRLVQSGRPQVANTPVILDSRKTETTYSGETELSRILAPGGKPVGWVEGRSGPRTRTVSSSEFDHLKGQLLKDSKPVVDPSQFGPYDGNLFVLPDGEIFGLRISRRHGETIDVFVRNTTRIDRGFKVHRK